MLYQVGWRVTRGTLACHCTTSMGCLHTYAARCSGQLTEGDEGGRTLLIFLAKFFIPNALIFHDKATCALHECRHRKPRREI